MSKHTPEPWRENSQGDAEYIYSEVHGAIATIQHGGLHREEHKANAARIVACVNACAGLDNKDIADLPSIINEGTVAISQRDTLLKALQDIIASSDEHPYIQNIAKNAIDKIQNPDNQ